MWRMKSLPVDTRLVISPAWRLTCGVPESPSVWVQRHTQNRRRHSLNSAGQGGGPEQRKKQSDGSRNWGQIHSGEWRPAITQARRSSYLSLSHKTPTDETEAHISAAFVVGLSIQFLYLLYRMHTSKSPVLAARLSQAIPTRHNRSSY